MITIERNPVTILPSYFPDGTYRIAVNAHKSVNKVRLVWRYKCEEEILQLIYVTRHLQDNNPNMEIELYMPYLPNARMDRVKSGSPMVFTLKYFCEIINSLKFHRVYVLDAHSHVGVALLDRVVNLMPTRIIDDIVANNFKETDNLLIYYPDEGAMKRYSELMQRPYAFGIKRRNFLTGEIEGLDIAGGKEAVEGKDVLIVDDICSYGGTFYYSAERLKEAGAKSVRLYVTHCESTICKGDLLSQGVVERVYTTNSIDRVVGDAQLHIQPCNIQYLVGKDLDEYDQPNKYKL